MTTPEQLAKWRKDFFKALGMTVIPNQRSLEVFCKVQEFEGYILAKQENEQSIKDARKLALEEAMKLAEDHRLDLDASEYHRGWRNASVRMSNLIQELLK